MAETCKISYYLTIKTIHIVKEDEMLESLVNQYGPKDWTEISHCMAKKGRYRQGKQCRERYAIIVFNCFFLLTNHMEDGLII